MRRQSKAIGLVLATIVSLAVTACGDESPDVVTLQTISKAELLRAELLVNGEAVQGASVDIHETALLVYGAPVDDTDDRPVLASWPIAAHVPSAPAELLLNNACTDQINNAFCEAPVRSEACDTGCRCADYGFGWWEMDAVVVSLGTIEVGDPTSTLRISDAPASDFVSEQAYCATDQTRLLSDSDGAAAR